jgi:hypothetical protein
MSYSITNVLKEAGIEKIIRWLPFDFGEKDVMNYLANKMIRPTTIPQTLEELLIEHSVAREALRLGLEHHKGVATRLRGEKPAIIGAARFDRAEETYIEMIDIDIVVGTGGLLSHAPRRMQPMIMLTDGFQLEGITWLFQDSVFMMPHRGVLSNVYSKAAWQIFEKDCLVRLGTVIAPKGRTEIGEWVMSVELEMPNGESTRADVMFGEIKRIPLDKDQNIKAIIEPHKDFDVCIGQGRRVEAEIMGGVCGLVLDGRGRPLRLPEDPKNRRETILKWFHTLDLYPKKKLEELEQAR